MDDHLRTRLTVYRDMPETAAGVVDFVENELSRLTREYLVTDATAGVMTSHLIAALTRVVKREPDIDPPSPAVYQQVVTQAPGSVDLATEVSGRAEAALGVRLTPVEEQYLSFHLAALAINATKERKEQS